MAGGTPGGQDPLPLASWVAAECGLNLAILVRVPGLHICSNINPEPKMTGRHSNQATPAGRRWETTQLPGLRGLVKEGAEGRREFPWLHRLHLGQPERLL